MVKPFCFLFFSIVYFQFLSPTQIHVFGDSHGSFCFSNERTAIPRNEHSYFNYLYNTEPKYVEFNINWFGSKTMFSMGRDGLRALNLKNYGVQENDVAVFVFGEIDARCHIGKQRDTKNRDLHEIIDSLVSNFMETIKQNKSQFNNVYCVIVSVTPPTDGIFDSSYPYHGTLEDRAIITKLLNKKLEELCKQYPFDFLDIYTLYANENGILDDNRSDKVVHVNPKENDQIKLQLIALLDHKYKLFN